LSENYIDFVTSTHSLYDRYEDTWLEAINSFHSGPEYKNAQYLRAYQVDLSMPSEQVNMYTTDDDGAVISKSRAQVQVGRTQQEVNRGVDLNGGSFYAEKLNSTPIFNYVKLIVQEYNSLLFRQAPHRELGDSPEMIAFLNDVDGEGNSLNEFMSLVDMMTTIYGVVHIGCYKHAGSDVPRFKLHTPLEVTNWKYKYDVDGNLKMDAVCINLEQNDYHSVYRVMTDEYIDTIFIGCESDDGDYNPPVDSPELEQLDDMTYRIRQYNELNRIPIVTCYQNLKVYNNIGSTVIFDVAGICRSNYGYSAEQYSLITFGSHPTLVIDENTDALNDGQIGSDPGQIVRVPSSLTGETNHVFEYKSPTLSSFTAIQDIIKSQTDKLAQISLLRTEDLVKSSRSGEQIEQYDDKLSALIRKKATNLENTEQRLFDLFFDWTNINMPVDFSISYNRQYNKRAIEQELAELDKLMLTMERYEKAFGMVDNGDVDVTVEQFGTEQEAVARAIELGGSGFHSHVLEDGNTIYMPFATHDEYEQILEVSSSSYDEPEFRESVRDKIRDRMAQLLTSTSTSNSL
jgi:hypothetical protein